MRPAVPGVYGAQNGGSYVSQGGARNAGSAGLDPRSSGNSGDVGQSLPRVNPIAPGREVDVLPVPNSPGVFEVDNAATGGPITIPGDTEPWGIDELDCRRSRRPQAAWNWGTYAGLELKKAQGGMTPGEKVRGKGSSKTGKGRLRETLGMFPTIGGFPNPWFDQPLKYRY